MISLGGARQLIDNIFIEDKLVMGAMNIDETIINKLRYLESAVDDLSPEECAAIEHWYKLLGSLENTLVTLSCQEGDVIK